MGCTFRNPDKRECGNPASHKWGPVAMCCDHFDQFVAGLLDLKDAITERRHIDIVEEYNRRMKPFNQSTAIGTDCKAKKKP